MLGISTVDMRNMPTMKLLKHQPPEAGETDIRKDRYYYECPALPWMLFVAQGGPVESFADKTVVFMCNGFTDVVRPKWIVRGDKDDPYRPAFEGGPAHWAAGHYKVSIWQARDDEKHVDGPLSKTLVLIQNEAVGPLIAILGAGYNVIPSGANLVIFEALKKVLADYVMTVQQTDRRVFSGPRGGKGSRPPRRDDRRPQDNRGRPGDRRDNAYKVPPRDGRR